jgi:chitodextrinase
VAASSCGTGSAQPEKRSRTPSRRSSSAAGSAIGTGAPAYHLTSVCDNQDGHHHTAPERREPTPDRRREGHAARRSRAPDGEIEGNFSSDADGRIVAFDWNFVDGTRGTGPTPSHRYTRRGRYFVKLTVTDNSGARDTFVQEVVVT